MAKSKNIRTIRRKINQYLELLKVNKISIDSAYLFGSYIRGNATEYSDIDLALITNKFIGDEFDFQFLLMKLAREIDIDIEPHPYLINDFNKSNPIANEILHTGEKIEIKKSLKLLNVTKKSR